eukprot:COSAG02_NODE_2385_length_8989_cov_8.689314_4_plen_115_part_00
MSSQIRTVRSRINEVHAERIASNRRCQACLARHLHGSRENVGLQYPSSQRVKKRKKFRWHRGALVVHDEPLRHLALAMECTAEKWVALGTRVTRSLYECTSLNSACRDTVARRR